MNDQFFDACSFGDLAEAKRIYVMSEIDINGNDRLALSIACMKGHLHILQWLHSIGIRQSELDKEFMGTITWPLYNLEVAKWLYSVGAKVSNRFLCNSLVLTDNVQAAKWLIDIGAIPKVGSEYYPYYEEKCEREEQAANEIKRWWKYHLAMRS